MTNLTCIVCPVGCSLVVDICDGEYKVSGNTCKRGIKYAKDELKNPKRMITTTVRVNDENIKLLPVKTRQSIPKEMIFEIMEELDKVIVNKNTNVGDVIVENILNTGVDIISSKTIMI